MRNTSDVSPKALSDAEREERLLSTGGLAARMRRAVIGTDQVCEALRLGQVCIVLEASDTSENTKKRLSDKALYYGVPLYRLSADCETLARAFGKRSGSVAAVGIIDSGIVKAMKKYLPQDFCDSVGETI